MKIRILLVDDSPTFMMAVNQYLGTFPTVQVVGQAHNGKEALALAVELQPDLVLLDISMAGMNGLEVARRLQTRPQPPSIILVTFNDCSAYRAETLDLDVLGFVGKSRLTIELPHLIETLISSKLEAGESC